MTTTTSLLPDIGTELREGYAQIGDTNLHYVEAGEGRSSFCCTASRSSGSVGGDRSRRSRRRVFESSPRHAWLQPVIEARGLRGLRRRSGSPPTFAASSESSVPSPRSWSVTTGAEASPGPWR